MISHQELLRLLDYDPTTGIFRWKVKIGRGASSKRPGDVAGGPRGPDGYIVISVFKHSYYAHRLAWFFVHKTWPYMVDHKDRNTSNNALGNLRPATHSQNCANNVGVPSRSKLGIKGVRYSVARKKYTARLYSNGKQRHLGSFKTINQAKAAYRVAALKANGEYARWR